MSQYIPQVAVPADKYGVYPACAGQVPASTGKRAGALLIDGGVGALTALIAPLFLVGPVWGTVVFVFALWALIAKAARPGGVLLGVVHVDVLTGRADAGKAFLKYLLEGLASALTFGIAPLVIWLATRAEGTGRHLFDRVAGVLPIDTKLGRGPVTDRNPAVVPLSQGPVRPAPIAQVGIGGGADPYFGAVGAAGGTGPYSSARPQGAVPDFGPPPHPAARPQGRANMDSWLPPTPGGGVPGGPAGVPPVPVVGPDAFIARTPFSGAGATSLQQAAPPIASEPVVIRDRPSIPADSFDETLLGQDVFGDGVVAAIREVVLDGTVPVPLTKVAVLGRNPAAAPELGAETVLPILDPGMSISKTHLAVGPDGDGWWVMDLHSTNGSRIVGSDGQVSKVVPGTRTPVPDGAVVRFGQHELRAR